MSLVQDPDIMASTQEDQQFLSGNFFAPGSFGGPTAASNAAPVGPSNAPLALATTTMSTTSAHPTALPLPPDAPRTLSMSQYQQGTADALTSREDFESWMNMHAVTGPLMTRLADVLFLADQVEPSKHVREAGWTLAIKPVTLPAAVHVAASAVKLLPYREKHRYASASRATYVTRSTCGAHSADERAVPQAPATRCQRHPRRRRRRAAGPFRTRPCTRDADIAHSTPKFVDVDMVLADVLSPPTQQGRRPQDPTWYMWAALSTSPSSDGGEYVPSPTAARSADTRTDNDLFDEIGFGPYSSKMSARARELRSDGGTTFSKLARERHTKDVGAARYAVPHYLRPY